MVSLLEIGISNCCFAVILAAIAMLVTRFSRNHQLACFLWLFVLVKLVTPPLWTISLPFGNSQLALYGVEPMSPLAGKVDSDEEASTLDENTTDQTPIEGAATNLPAVTTTIDRMPRRWDLPLTVAWIWGLSSCAWALSVVVRVRRFQHIVDAAEEPSSELRSLAVRLSRRINLKRPFEIKTIEQSLLPMLWPLGRMPVVLLPSRLIAELSPQQLETVILHELAHLRRRDDWVVMFESIVTSLFWWNPIVWLSRSRLREATEQCCDELVVQSLPGSRRHYGEALLQAAEFELRQRSLPVYGNAFGRRHLLKERIEMILKSEFNQTPPFARTLFCAFGIAVLPLAASATIQSDEILVATPVARDEAVANKTADNQVQPKRKAAPRPRRAIPRREVWAMDADGRNPRKVAHFGDFAIVNSPEVSPDGNFVAVDGWKARQNLRDARVLVVDVRNGNVKDLVKGCMPTWSPDGKWIALCKYGDERGVYIRSLDGKVERLLDRDGWGIQWSPDGLKAAYSRRGKLIVYNFVSDTERVVEPADWDYTYIYWNPTWSPDSKQVCFKARHKDGHSEFAIVNVTSNMAVVRRRINADNFNEDIAWHSNGSRILIPRKRIDGGQAQICEFDPNGTAEPVPVDGQPKDRHQGGLCWTRDGKTLFFISFK